MEERRKLVAVLFFGVVLVVILLGLWWGFVRNRPQAEPVFSEISVAKEDASLTITREGTLTVRNKYGLFQQQWDEERVARFFARFETTDFSRFSDTCGKDAYCLTISLSDGSQVTYSVSEFDFDLPDAVEEIIEILEEMGDVVPEPSPTPTVGVSITPTPTTVGGTPTPTSSVPTPTPTIGGGGGDGGDDGGGDGELKAYQIPFECSFLDPGARSNILSETVCTPE